MPYWCDNQITITGPNSVIDKIEKIVREEENIDLLYVRIEDFLNYPIETIIKICSHTNLEYSEYLLPKKISLPLYLLLNVLCEFLYHFTP